MKCSAASICSEVMDDKLTPADPRDLVACLTFALTSDSRLAKAQAAEIMAKIVAERIAAQLERDRFVIMRKPSEGGAGGVPRRD